MATLHKDIQKTLNEFAENNDFGLTDYPEPDWLDIDSELEKICSMDNDLISHRYNGVYIND